MLRTSLALTLLFTASVASADRFDAVRAQIREVMVDQNVPSIAVSVANKGKIVWEEGFGWANAEKRIPASVHTLYSLASVSKPVTATALMILVERGAVDLNKPIDEYLGKQKLTAHVGDAREATVRRVANHTSGLPLHYQFFYEDESVQRPTMEESIRRYGVLVRPPGESFYYSNFGYGLLEYVIERTSGKSYAEFLRDEVFPTLGLKESAVNRLPDFGDRVAVRYINSRAVPFYDFDHRGASAVFMSAHDLARFGLFHLNGRFLEPMTRDAVANAERKNSYGLGWIMGERHGMKQVSHTGSMPGVAALLSLYPDAGISIALLANSGAPIGSIEGAIVHALLPDTIRGDHGFKPQPELVGRWQGAVETYAGETPLEIDFKDNGSVFARVGSAPMQEVMQAKLDPQTSLLTLEDIAGDIRTPDAARYPCRLNFQLKLRSSPTALNGAVTAVSNALPDRGNALSYWVELRKQGISR